MIEPGGSGTNISRTDKSKPLLSETEKAVIFGDLLDPTPGSENDAPSENFLKRGLNKLAGIAGGTKDTAGRSAELARHGGEALFSRMGQALEDRKAFGKSVANFALHGATTRGLSMGGRELAKGIVSYSGLAGAVGGGLTGTIVAGAFVGAVSGALVEYARQVYQSIDEKAEADPSLAGRRAAFLLKFKELRHAEVLNPTDLKKIGIAAISGAIAGAGAGALREFFPQIIDFAKDHAGSLGSVFSGAKEIAGNVGENAGNIPGVQGAGDLASGAWHGAGEVVGNVGEAAGNIPGVQGAGDLASGAWHGAGELAGNVGENAGNIPGVQGAGDLASGAWHGAGEIVDNARHAVGLEDTPEAAVSSVPGITSPAPEGFVPQSDYDDVRQQLAEAKQALADTGTVTGAGAAANEAAADVSGTIIDQTHTALSQLPDSIALPAGSNPWEVSAGILRSMGMENPTPPQIMELDKIMCQQNGISVPDWGIKGTIDSHNLPIGFKFNLTDEVRKAALGIATKK